MSFIRSALVIGSFWLSDLPNSLDISLIILWSSMFEDNKIASKAFLFISTISLGTIAFILAVLFSFRIKDNSPKISPVSIFPIFFPSISATSPPEITRKAVSPFSPSRTIY